MLQLYRKMEQPTYSKRSGTTNKGLEYEVLGVANLAINLVTDERIKDFHISSNHSDFGAFDDIVIETKQGNRAETHAIQLKHSKGTLSLEQLKAKSGNFSIKKYFESAQSIKVSKAKFILYTNLKFNVENDTEFCIDGEDFLITVTKINTNEAFQISEKTDYCYQFSIVKDESSVIPNKVLLYDNFFHNFFLYTDQDNSHDLKVRVTEKFKSSFCGSEVECNEYVRFLSEWSSQEGRIEKLNKKWMILAIALKIFYSRIKPLSFDSNINIEATKITRTNILRDAIDTFDVTIFAKESYDELKKLWVDAKNELTDLKIINNLRLKYQLASSRISDINNLDSLTLSVLLWLLGKAPLVLTQDASVSKAIELCVGKEFILLGNECENSFSETISVFNTLSDLKTKTTEYGQVIGNLTCSLQGKCEIRLENLVRDKEDILINLKTDDLLEMVKGRCLIGEAKEDLSNPYINRCLSKVAIEIKILDNLSRETVVILECVSQKPNLKKTLTNHELINISNFLNAEESQNVEHSVQKISNSCTIYLSEQPCDYSEFISICNKVKNSKNFHQFRIKDDGNLEWIRSQGDVSDIEKYKSFEYYYVKESDLDCSEFTSKINLLATDPGMGKSELMRSFKINSFSEFLTVIINPKDVYSFLKNKRDFTNYVDTFLKFVLDEKYKILSERDQAIFRIFLKQHEIIIVWDALDEISDEHRDIVSDIIAELSKNFLQWVTSRRHLVNTLQQKFGVLSLNLNRFDELEQTRYIQHRLAHLDKTETIETIIQKISSSFALVEHKDILGIPLQIFMLTELFRRDKQKYSNLLDNFFVLTDLYDYFIQEKINIQFREKLEIDLNTAFAERLVQIQKEQMLELCTKAALILLFPGDILTEMSVCCRNNFTEIYENHQNIGLITEVKDNIPRFIHNSFAEYLAARYLSKQLHRKDVLEHVMFDPKYINVRFFFDLLLARNSQAHVAILYKNFSFIRDCNSDILTSTDLGGRSVLHLACSWGQRYPELTVKSSGDSCVIDEEGNFNITSESEEYLGTIDHLLEKCDIYKLDKIYNMTPEEYARKSTCLPAEMRVVMKQNTETTVGTDHMMNILYYSAYHGYQDEFEFYFNLLEHDSTTNIKIPCHMLVNVRNHFGMTLIYTAAEMGHLRIVEILVKAGADINLFEEDNWTPLHIVSQNGHETIVEILLKAGADINFPSKDNFTPLFIASQNGHDKIGEILLKAGADINLPSKDGVTPLFIASENGHDKVVEILLKDGADVNLPSKGGVTPLHIASHNGHETIVELLLKGGANVNLTSKEGFAPLHIASQQGHEAIGVLLLKAGGDISLPTKDGVTPLYIACENGHATIVGILLKAGADISVTNKDGCTLLYWASANGHETVVEILLEAGADINLADDNGVTPLCIASHNGHATVVEILLKADADISLADNNGCTPLYWASAKGHETIVKTLVKAGAGVKISNKNEATPLYVASENGHERIIEILFKAGADLNLSSKNGATPLHIAAQEGHETVVEILLKTGADISVTNKEGCTPLYWPSAEGHETIVEMLLQAGVLVNLPGKDGSTPLHMASHNGHETVVEMLLKADADVNLSREDGWTPLHIATQSGHETVVKILLKAGADSNLPLKEGWTPLHIASQQGHETIVNMLINAGADITLASKDGWTPFGIASQNGHETIKAMLLITALVQHSNS